MSLVLVGGPKPPKKGRKVKGSQLAKFVPLPKRAKTRWGPIPKRKRWASAETKKTLSQDIQHLAEVAGTMDEKESQVYFLKLKLAQNAQKLYNPVQALLQNPGDLSPSPPPQYDTKGKRLNTREFRYRQKLEKQRNDLLTKILNLDSKFKIPSHWKKPVYRAKLVVPVDKFPEVNFFGLIVGPRGMTQKRLSKETGCGIFLRGRGSFMPGKPGRTPQDDDNEPMYVDISGPTQKQVDKAKNMCLQLMDQSKSGEAYKQKQLAELKSVLGWGGNPTKRCRICGGVGHPIWKCPDRPGADWDPAQVQCELCGEVTHITSDCKLYNKEQPMVQAKKAMTLDEEYSKFLSDLAGDGSMKTSTAGAIKGEIASKDELKKKYPTGRGGGPFNKSTNSPRGRGNPRGGRGRGGWQSRSSWRGGYRGTSAAAVGGNFSHQGHPGMRGRGMGGGHPGMMRPPMGQPPHMMPAWPGAQPYMMPMMPYPGQMGMGMMPSPMMPPGNWRPPPAAGQNNAMHPGYAMPR